MRWLANLLRRRRVERELDDELRFHVEAHTRDLIAEGVAPDEARRRALASFGGLEPIKEAAREVRPGRWLDDLLTDVRYAARALRHQPGFAIVAILTLTLGIGANTAIFSMVNAVLLRPLPVRDPSRLVLFTDEVNKGERFSNKFPGGQWSLFSTDAYDFIRERRAPFESVAAFASGDFLAGLQLPGPQTGRQAAIVKSVSGNYFETLGATAARGRALMPGDDKSGALPVAVASDAFWRERLAADPDVLGRVITIGEVAYAIVGVMPPGFFGVSIERAPDIWAPLSLAVVPPGSSANRYWLTLIGRLPPGQTMASAQTSVTHVLHQYLSGENAAAITDEVRARIDTVHVRMADGSRGISVTRAQRSRLLVLLLSAVGVILLIACANVGTLFLGRAAAREREIAVRRALGAGKGRLIRQWLTEGALLGGLGALCGAGVGRLVAPRLLATFVPPTVPVEATIDGSVLAFTTSITLLACLLFGLAPALNAGRVDPLASLRSTGRSQLRRRTFGVAEPFVVTQIAMSLVLVIGATLLVRTLVNLQEAPTGLDQERVLLVALNPRPARYTAATVGDLYRQMQERLAGLSGVDSVSFSRGFRSSVGNAYIEGYAPAKGETSPVDTFLVGPDYTRTMGMPLLRGRALGSDDTTAKPLVGMVNETFANRYFQGSSPIGRHVTVGSGAGRTYEIVGVVRDAHFRNAREEVLPGLFIGMLQEASGRALDCEFDIRVKGDASAVTDLVRQTIASIDPRISIGKTRTLRADVLSTLEPERTAVGFIGSFAALALLVSSIGLYGIVSHGLARRTNEIGVRMALGADRLDVVRLIARETALRLGIGLAIGVVLAQAAGGVLHNQLFGVETTDLPSLTIATLILSAVVILTTVRPLVRAMRTDPVIALRAE